MPYFGDMLNQNRGYAPAKNAGNCGWTWHVSKSIHLWGAFAKDSV